LRTTISRRFLVVLVFWLTTLFMSFGLFAPRNATAVTALVVSAISVAGALFLVLELDQPFSGIMRLSDALAPAGCHRGPWPMTPSAGAGLVVCPGV
jgi:nitric oxide reductase large subunit